MKCAVIQRHGTELTNVVIQNREDLTATGEDVRVKVVATALNRADLLQRRGLYNPPQGVVQDIPGLEFVGYVDKVGNDVTEWRDGDRVLGIVAGGAHAEQVVTNQWALLPVPEELSHTEAAAIPEAFITAHDALVTQGGMKHGDLVLVHSAAGGVGSAAIQLVNLFDARAAGTVGSTEKMQKVAEITPYFGINYREDDFQKSIEAEFGPSPVDLVLDTVGASYLKRNIELLKDRGTLVIVGLMGGAEETAPLAEILRKRLHVIGTVLRSRSLEERIEVTQAFAHQVIPHFTSGELRPLIDSVFPFDQLHKATERMENNENTGKIVLELSI